MESPQFFQPIINDVVNKVDARVSKSLEQFKKELLAKDANDDLLTREQAAEFLQINLSTLWHWTNAGKIKAYGISGHRRYYKRSELLEALQLVKK
ncbi:helix-turn-helix domain-containing protein [Flagellimonas myxillae]|uniref:helix-turn-helix domain-containing protein n=1 Tax=Flagellimonas myxillae TaxID=2942214 RepID=UPI00201F325B|nr:helix-turn-helix domain-containing protein [Muricauda myxillae]MCL6266569.1 helix-turn-helix domain-containing protein [Muricauda myxillae]